MALWKFSNLNKYGNVRSRIVYHPDNKAFGINPKGFGPFIGVSRFKYVSRSTFNPVLADINGKRYMMPDWIEVLPETTLNDIKKTEPKVKKVTEEQFTNKSSCGTKLYLTRKITNKDGSVKLTCSCPGAWRAKDRECKHIKKLKNGK